MHKYYKLPSKDKKLKPPLEYHLIKLTTFGLLTFLITLLASSALTPIEPTNAEELLLATQAIGDTVSLSTSGTINLDPTTNSTGAVRTVSDQVKVTAGNSGYQLYISTATSTNALVRDGTDGSNTTDTIPAGGGDTVETPIALSDNTWGFAVTKRNTASGSGSEDVLSTAGFDEEYPTDVLSSTSSKFTKVPTRGNDLLIASRTSAAEEVLTNVYYGAKVNTAKTAGLYKNTITYTVISASGTGSMASIDPASTNQISGGITLAITTPSTLTLDSLGTTTVTVGGAEMHQSHSV